MEKVHARYNWASGWVAECPHCNQGEYDGRQSRRVAEQVEPGRPMVCGKCYPGIRAQKLIEYQRHMVIVDDTERQNKAFQQALAAGRAYEVVFPKEKGEIMALLHLRPRRAMNWWPGITLRELRRENKEHGV